MVRIKQATLLALGSIPALIPLWLIYRYGINAPYLDQWFPDMAGMHARAHRQELSLWDLTVQHNEHRILLPRLIYLLVNWITHHNTRFEMFLGWLVVAATSLGILWLIQHTLGVFAETEPSRSDTRLRPHVVCLWFLCNIAIFTPAQSENWLWGLGMIIFLPAMFLVAGIIAAVHPRLRRWPKTLLVILCCSAATYSYGNGVMTWPLVAIVYATTFSKHELKVGWRSFAAIGAAFAINLTLYLVNFSRPSHGQTNPYQANITEKIHFFFLFLGNPFTATLQRSPVMIATICGAGSFFLLLTICSYFAFIRRGQLNHETRRNLVVWVAIAGYAISAASIAAILRTGFGPSQANASRYVSFPIYLSVALVPLVYAFLNELRRLSVFSRRCIAGVMALVLIGLNAVGLPSGLAYCRIWQHTREEDHGTVLLMRILPDDPQLAHAIPNDPPGSVEHALMLDEIGYLNPPLIRDPNAARIESSSDLFAEGVLVRGWQSDATTLTCVGWATLPTRHKAADTVFVTCDNDRGEPIIVAHAVMGAHWEGVIPTFDDPYYRWAGWAATIPLSRLPVGTRSMQIRAWVLDSSTGQACRLKGSVGIER